MASTFAKNNQTCTTATTAIEADTTAKFWGVTLLARCDANSAEALLIQVQPIHGTTDTSATFYDKLDAGESAYYGVNGVGMPKVVVKSESGGTATYSLAIAAVQL